MRFKMHCGCSFPKFGEEIKECDGLPPIEINYYDLPECPLVYNMLGSGRTKGVFQLEKSLGKHWCKELYPENLNHLAALSAILRPGALLSKIDNKSITEHYCDNKNGRQEKRPIHPALEKILEETEQVLIYQEQILWIAKEIAGFSGSDADTLRRGIGHKDPKIIFEMEKKFLDGCEKIGSISLEDAKVIFDIIRKSSRYLFNASHSYSYGTIGYFTGYLKSHFPLHFYTAYLAHARNKQDSQEEIRELVEDAKYYDIDIQPPHIISLKDNKDGNFTIHDKKILFGIVDIKGIGLKQVHKLYDSIQEKEQFLNRDIEKWSWEDFMINIKTTSTVMNNLILVGATPGGKPRKQKSYEYSIFSKLTKRELEWFKENYNNYEDISDALNKYSSIDKKDGGPSNYKRRDFVENSYKNLKDSPYSTKDNPDWVVSNERELMGIPITYSSVENKYVFTGMTCTDFLAKKSGKIDILVEIVAIKDYTIKNGKNAGMQMCFLDLRDDTANISGIMFSEAYFKNQEFLFEGNTVVVSGFRSKKDDSGLIINRVQQV